MDIKSGALDFWRTYFRNANSDIFEVIDYAILIAASDCPNEFRLRQGQIAEKLFSCGCQHVELAVPEEEGEGEGNEEDNVFKNSCRGGRHLGNKQSKMNNDSETLTVEIEEESETVGLVLRIKGVLDNHQEEADGVLFDCLRRLQLMKLTVETLQETQIGKTVYSLRKHGLKQIQHLARDLIKGWKQMVDEWINDLDDFADPLNNGDLDKNCGNGREPTLKDHVQIKPSNFDSKMTSEHKADGDAKSQQRKDLVEVQTKPPATNVQDKSNNSNEILSAKLEEPKRKLHEQYQQLENDVSNNPELLTKMVSILQDGDDFDCPVCLSPATETIITYCAHIFCRSCILKTLQRLNPRCPICRHPLSKSDLYSAPPQPSDDDNPTSSSTGVVSSKVSTLLKLLMMSREENRSTKSLSIP